MKEIFKAIRGGDRAVIIVVAITAALLAMIVYVGYQAIMDAKTLSDIKHSQREANTAVNVAVEHEAEASNISAERQTEDDYRETTIQPKLETARRNSNSSKIQLERAQKKFNEKTDPHNVNGTWADNCARLKRVFPDTEFEYCHDAGK